MNGVGRARLVGPSRRDFRRLSQRPDTLCGQGPTRRLRGDSPAGAQHVAGNCQFVGGRADIAGGVVEDEVFEMDEFAVDPQRRAGVGEILAFDPAGADR